MEQRSDFTGRDSSRMGRRGKKSREYFTIPISCAQRASENPPRRRMELTLILLQRE